jgi:hypothetical protein
LILNHEEHKEHEDIALSRFKTFEKRKTTGIMGGDGLVFYFVRSHAGCQETSSTQRGNKSNTPKGFDFKAQGQAQAPPWGWKAPPRNLP